MMAVQRSIGRLKDVRQIAFGKSLDERWRAIDTGVLVAGGVVALAELLIGGPLLTMFCAAIGIGTGLTVLIGLQPDSEMRIDFMKETYRIDGDVKARGRLLSGPLSHITSLKITRIDVQDHLFAYATYICFDPQLSQEPFRMDTHRCSVKIGDISDRVHFCLELAQRLQVPVVDDSGWQSWREPLSKPEMYMILPGEPHPVWLLARGKSF